MKKINMKACDKKETQLLTLYWSSSSTYSTTSSTVQYSVCSYCMHCVVYSVCSYCMHCVVYNVCSYCMHCVVYSVCSYCMHCVVYNVMHAHIMAYRCTCSQARSSAIRQTRLSQSLRLSMLHACAYAHVHMHASRPHLVKQHNRTIADGCARARRASTLDCGTSSTLYTIPVNCGHL